MAIKIIAAESIPSDIINDDRVGTRGNLVWVIDGATDIGDGPIVDEHSDAAWLADTASDWLHENSDRSWSELPAMLPELTSFLSDRFENRKCREPNGRYEHPSASFLVARANEQSIDYMAVGDCTLLVKPSGSDVARYGTDEKDAGDAWLTSHIKKLAPRLEQATSTNLRQALKPTLRQARALMNRVPGYGVLSITEPPARYVRHGKINVEHGTRLLLASDGYLRLTDVYGKFTVAELFEESFAQGVPTMLKLLREIEEADANCTEYPRAKTRDDASVIVAEYHRT